MKIGHLDAAYACFTFVALVIAIASGLIWIDSTGRFHVTEKDLGNWALVIVLLFFGAMIAGGLGIFLCFKIRWSWELWVLSSLAALIVVQFMFFQQPLILVSYQQPPIAIVVYLVVASALGLRWVVFARRRLKRSFSQAA
jgi:hypothetical protein